MEMDKTLKILLACLGVAGIAVIAIPPGDPLTNSDQAVAAPVTPAAPTTPTTEPNAPQAPSAAQKKVNEGEEYVPPASDQNPTPTADAATLQQQSFGQPMIDPRPMSEQKAQSNNNGGTPRDPNFRPNNGEGYGPPPGYMPPPPPNYGYAPINSRPEYGNESDE
jgi:hypothetical protein